MQRSKPQTLKHTRLREFSRLKVFLGVLISTLGGCSGDDFRAYHTCMYMKFECAHTIGSLASQVDSFLAQFAFVFYLQQYISWVIHTHPESYVGNICLPWRPPT